MLVLDQRELPHREVWLSLENAEEMAGAIHGMALRGAPLIGIAAAYALALEAKQLESVHSSEAIQRLRQAGELLRSARPTAVNLSRAVDRMEKAAQIAFAKGEPLFDALEAESLEIHLEDRRACAQIGQHGVKFLGPGAVLTHCNTGSLATGGDGTAYAVIKEGVRQGKVSHVFVCETRPYLQGAKLTAYELLADKIPFTLITDSMAGHFMSIGSVNGVIVGADRIAANGDTANKIGTYSLAVLAKENTIPFFVAAPTWTIDFSIPTGQSIPIEERSANEVVRLEGVLTAPEGTPAKHPAFDITPARFIHAFLTDQGIVKPPYGETLVSLRMNGKGIENKTVA